MEYMYCTDINDIKRQKFACDDLLTPENFIDTKHILAPVSCRLVNFIYDKGIYPESWTKYFSASSKEDDLYNVDNYIAILKLTSRQETMLLIS